jgi:hypothetical protein
MFNNPAKDLGKITKAFSRTLTDLDSFIAKQIAARADIDKKAIALVDESLAIADIQKKAERVRGKIANLIED